jgi:hypothetical protein
MLLSSFAKAESTVSYRRGTIAIRGDLPYVEF